MVAKITYTLLIVLILIWHVLQNCLRNTNLNNNTPNIELSLSKIIKIFQRWVLPPDLLVSTPLAIIKPLRNIKFI